MAESSNIEWCDSTFNPWEGCQKVSPGCDNCYAEARNARFGGGLAPNWGAGAPRRLTSRDNWAKPVRWNAQADAFEAAYGRRRRVFCASLADVFDNQAQELWREELFELIRITPRLDWLLLTKRPQNIVRMVRHSGAMAGNGTRFLPDNVWLGTTAENQQRLDLNLPALLDARDQLGARLLFLSIEPMLGPIYLPKAHAFGLHGFGVHKFGVDWVICGGESGHGARPMHPDWARSLRDQCELAGVPFLFKQWGEYTAHEVDPDSYHTHLSCIDANGGECALSRGYFASEKGEPWWFLPPWPGRGTWGPDGIPAGVLEVRKVGKKAAGRLLDGVEHNGFPQVFR